MSNKKDGGAAFPRSGYDQMRESGEREGMSLRDYLAGQALIAMLSDEKLSGSGHPDSFFATAACEMADAMLKAREE